MTTNKNTNNIKEILDALYQESLKMDANIRAVIAKAFTLGMKFGSEEAKQKVLNCFNTH